MRTFTHPNINHTFIIKDISIDEVEIDGVRLHKRYCDGLVTTANNGGSKQTTTLGDLSLPVLQHVLFYKNQNKDEEK